MISTEQANNRVYSSALIREILSNLVDGIPIVSSNTGTAVYGIRIPNPYLYYDEHIYG